MDRIVNFVNDFFTNVDKQDWENVEEALMDEVWMDYRSFRSEEPSYKRSHLVVTAWKDYFKGFDVTYHQVSNIVITGEFEEVFVSLYVVAYHYIHVDNEAKYEILVGTYDMELNENEDEVRIASLRFNFQFRIGDKEIEELARVRLKG